MAVVAVRTGCGKSQVSHYIIERLKERGLKCVLVRHPMPYGESQSASRLAGWLWLADHGWLCVGCGGQLGLGLIAAFSAWSLTVPCNACIKGSLKFPLACAITPLSPALLALFRRLGQAGGAAV